MERWAWCTSLLICTATFCILQGGALRCTDSAVIGETYALNVSQSSPESLCIQLNSSTETEAIRVIVESENASFRHPVLVTVRQAMGVVSWALPYIESGVFYSTVERTLCPLLNRDESGSSVLLIDLSTSDPSPLPVYLRTTIISSFILNMNNSVAVEASPSGPSYLQYKYDAPPTNSRVRVTFRSSEDTSHICAIASIQTGLCPVVELLDNPDHRGRYQTMKSIASINTRVNSTHSGFFYVVVTVFPSDGRDSSCVFTEQGLGDELIGLDNGGNNFNPVSYSGQNRTKRVVISVEPALSDSSYVIAIVVSTIVYVSFYIVALVWIVIFDWWRYDTHFIFKMLQKDPNQFAESAVVSPEPEVEMTREQMLEENLSEEYLEPVRPDSSDEDEYDGPPIGVAMDTPDASVRSSVFSRAKNLSDQSDRLIKRPSLISVLFGTHLSLAIDEVSPHNPQPHSPTPPHGRRRYISESNSLNPANLHSSPPFKRHKSISESHAVSPTVTRSLTSSIGRHMISHVTSPLAESHDKLRVRKTDANTPDSTAREQTDSRDAPVITVTNEERGDLRPSPIRKQESYTAAVEGGEDISQDEEGGRSCDTNTFPVNMTLCELGEIDDSPAAQKKYNRFSVYLLVIIVFYGIPAYQLVITYQRLLSASGNEDVCYYNSLCAHPWDIYTGLSLSAFNNIFSNIGFFILGFLYILIAYRRRYIYRSFELYNCHKAPAVRVGVPQHFGIYYAIGLALMAEAFMSVAYHICPSSTNYQFDTTFMYLLAALGLHKLLESRCPDLDAGLHKIMLTLAFIIVVVVVGVLYSDSIVFWLLFFAIYVVFAFVFSVEIYYRWQIKPTSMRKLYRMYRGSGLCPPQHIPKFVMAIVSIAVNWLFAFAVVAVRPIDFGTYFLFILLSNFIMYLLYYTITKMVYREFPSPRPLIFVILALVFWVGAIYFYTRTVTDWSVPPALSRDKNVDCLVLGFYDSHDMWHFLSAFALFFSFLMLMTLDDRQEDKSRDTLRAF